MRIALLALLLGCQKDLVKELPDAAVPAPMPDAAIPPLAGDYSCATTPWPTTAPDPLRVSGAVGSQPSGTGKNGVVIEVRAAGTDALLGMATTASKLMQSGVYSVAIPTGGVAPIIYRKLTPVDLDMYIYDATADSDAMLFAAFFEESAATLAGFGQAFGVTIDPTKGAVIVQIADCASSHSLDGSVVGATVEAPPGSTVIYDLSHPSAPATIAGGQALILNVPAGPLDLVIHAGPVAYRPWPVMVHANAWTITSRKP